MPAPEHTPIAAITRRVMIEQLRDYRLLVLGIGTAFLLVLGTYVSLLDYAQRVKTFALLRSSRFERSPLEAVLLVRTPPRLLFISEGGESTIPSTLVAIPGFIDAPQDQITSRSLLPSGAGLDWSFTFAYIFSLAALMCTADLVIRQRAVGVLRVVMSYPVRRAGLLAGEYLGAFAALLPFVVVALAAGHALVLGSRAIEWGATDWIRSAAFAMLTLAFLSLLCVLGLAISTVCRDRTTCLLTAITVWVFGAIVVPALAGPVAHAIVQTPTEREHHDRLQETQRHFDPQIFVSSEMLMPLTRAGLSDAERAALARSAQADLVARHEAKLSEYKQQLLAIRRDYLVRTTAEARLAAKVSLLSPFSAYTRLAADLAGAGVKNQDAFYSASERFLLSYTEAALELRRRLRPLAHVMGPTVEVDGIKLQGVASISYADVTVDRGAIPTFSGYEVPLRDSLTAALAGVLMFLAADVVVFSLLVYRFNRYVFD
ncbi:MAG TPA: ABC transporter permease subunit [Thermoanaerobaculia bacterium]|jgi:ABC-type transport system involved in multi-copper enzyme maturation permease subunit|nr:ABC transporter permease subunit [Thermoanaerobaculia bacterium]